jgi:hypothetical protein
VERDTEAPREGELRDTEREDRLLRLTPEGAERLREETELLIPEEPRELRVEMDDRPVVARDEPRLGDRTATELRDVDLRDVDRIVWDRLEEREEVAVRERDVAREVEEPRLVRERIVD